MDIEGELRADPERLGVALDALVENAVNATGPSDDIVLSSRTRNGAVALEVADSGSGIAPELPPTLFERFSRLNGDRGRGTGGTVLGLAIVRAVAEAHGGTVEAESPPGAHASVSCSRGSSR